MNSNFRILSAFCPKLAIKPKRIKQIPSKTRISSKYFLKNHPITSLLANNDSENY